MANFINVSTNKTGFSKLSYSITALPVISFLKLDGFSGDGVTWDNIEPASVRQGADGLGAINQKPVLYSGTISFLPNSNCRNVLDILCQQTTPRFGRRAMDYELILTEYNETAKTKTVYYGGAITEAPAGNSANLEDGQQDKTYRLTFIDRDILPF